jgi:hypothetical protein
MLMRKPISLVIVCLILLSNPASVLAWSGAGHMVIAAGAYRQLSPEQRLKVDEILTAHPDYEKWKRAYKPGEIELETFVFMRASTWPDEIRRGSGGDRQYDHPHWHYVDYPLHPPKFQIESGPSPTDDVLYGIAQCEKTLSDKNASPELRAVYLAYLIHLVGDIHQPLHCASLFTEAYPKGDKGGNDFYVMPGSRGIKLHSLWDGLLGTSGSPQSHLNYALEIEKQHPRKSLSELKRNESPRDWSLEGRQLAVDKAYLHGELKGSSSPENAPALPEGYTKEVKAVAEKQAALAAYRLADEIGRWMR